MARKCVIFVLLVAALCWIFTGCGSVNGSDKTGNAASNTENGGTMEANNEPVTLKVFQDAANITDQEFEQYFTNPVKEKYPYITLELVRSTKENSIASLVAAGQVPDIIFTANTVLNTYHQLDVPYDLSNLIKKHNIDLSQFDPVTMKAIQDEFGPAGNMGLPFSNNYYVTFYNKEIFDKFGIAYPKDKMTWEQMTELAKKVTREDGGTQYHGLIPGTVNTFGMGMALPYVDAKTNKPMADSPGWKKVFEVGQAIYTIPGNYTDPKQYGASQSRNVFMNEKSLAMLPFFGTGIVGDMEQLTKDGKVPFQWDMASYPSFKDNPGKSAASNFHLLLLSATSTHKEQAFAVMALTASKEVQLNESKNGRVSILKGQEYEKTFGNNLTSLKGKNVPAIFMTQPTLNPSPTQYDTQVTGPIDRAFKSVISENKDINTALREAQDAAAKAIQEAMAQ